MLKCVHGCRTTLAFSGAQAAGRAFNPWLARIFANGWPATASLTRNVCHAESSGLLHRVTRTEFDLFPTEEAARHREELLICVLNPRFNGAGKV